MARKPRARTRATGTNPRARQTQPRAKGTNPSAGTASDQRRVRRLLEQAHLIWLDNTGQRWCSSCDDQGYVTGTWGAVPCPDHQQMTAREAELICEHDRAQRRLARWQQPTLQAAASSEPVTVTIRGCAM